MNILVYIFPGLYLCILIFIYLFSSVQSLSHVWLFATSWTASYQASLSLTNSWSLLKTMSIESVMSSNQVILCHSLLLLPSVFSAPGSYPVSQFFAWGGQTIRASASASVLSLLFNMLSRLIMAFLPRIKCLLISWLQSPSTVILEKSRKSRK